MRAFAAILLALTVVGARATEPATPYDVKQAPWPCWRGPYFNGSAPDQGIELIDDLGLAKLLWTSDVPIPAAHPGSGGVKGYWACGYSSPIVAQGRVYVAYWTPPGRTTYAFTEEDKKPEYRFTRRNPANRDDLTADDVLHCFDAKTGKTLFRTVLAGKGLMRPGSKQGCHMTPCWWDGKVYFSGSAERHYCLDATTGELVWEAETAISKVQDEKKKQGRLDKSPNYAAPVVIDGVVAIPTGTNHGSSLIGYDAAKGTVLWEVGKLGGVNSVSTPWSHEGKGYFICKGELIEAKTGKVPWDAAASMPKGGRIPDYSTWPASGNHVVLIRMMSPAGGGVTVTSPVCFKISPSECKPAWTGQASVATGRGLASYEAPIIYHDRVYVVGKGSGGSLRCYDLESGKLLGSMPVGRTLNRFNDVGSSNVAVDGRLLCPQMMSVAMVTADPKGLRLLGEAPVGLANSTSIAYADGLLYFRTESNTDARVVCYDLRAGGK